MQSDAFQELIRRVRAGDRPAARWTEEGETVIRQADALPMKDARLRAHDSIDICQSVLGTFFIHAANGEKTLARPNSYAQLLVGDIHAAAVNDRFHGGRNRYIR